jgi:hypothetical protein
MSGAIASQPTGELVTSHLNLTRSLADVWGLSEAEVAAAREEVAVKERKALKRLAKAAPKPLLHAGAGTQRRFVLRDWKGAYLHQSGSGMTQNRSFAWCGTQVQLQSIRAAHPEARELIASAVL